MLPLDQIVCGDNREVAQAWPADSIDAIVTDPPYGLAFMGKEWDHGVPGEPFWREFLRVAKPGAHLLAFGGTRTFHRLACAIEDAGWEIRDTIMYVYGSGFPKSLDVGKAIDKAAGLLQHEGKNFRNTSEGRMALRPTIKPSEYVRPAPATDAAKQWDGWGTALKPAFEPIIVARKPLDGTVADNVLKWGTGGINVDGCRVGTDGGTTRSEQAPYAESGWITGHKVETLNAGRWPANIIHDGSEEVLGLFPEDTDSGSAARFFYTAKASQADRGYGNDHPTVKPTDLMRYLVRLVCPIGGIVLDPFNGSGATTYAARAESCRHIGIDLNEGYCEIARKRLAQGVLF